MATILGFAGSALAQAPAPSGDKSAKPAVKQAAPRKDKAVKKVKKTRKMRKARKTNKPAAKPDAALRRRQPLPTPLPMPVPAPAPVPGFVPAPVPSPAPVPGRRRLTPSPEPARELPHLAEPSPATN